MFMDKVKKYDLLGTPYAPVSKIATVNALSLYEIFAVRAALE
jgi:hypothetical protein